MSPLIIFIIALVVFLILTFQGLPVAFSFALVGFLGVVVLRGSEMGLYVLGAAPFAWASSTALLALPLFILMGNFVFHSGMSTGLFQAANTFVGRFPGGLALATTVACAGFAACSGSSMASAATMGAICFPQMKKYNYHDRLSTGSISAGGTLATLIPPSAGMIIYGFITNNSVAELFIAGVLPGLLITVLFMIMIYFMCKRNPVLGPRGETYSWRERFSSLKGIIGVMVLFLLVIGGLYFGIFTPSEAGAAGAFGALIIGLVYRKLKARGIIDATKDTVKTTAFIFAMLFGAMIFNTFLGISGFSPVLSEFITSLPFSRYVVLSIIIFLYIPLGMFMDTLAIMLLTMPIVYPVIMNLGFDGIWFGVIITILCELALITPPVGMNVYIVQGVTKVPMSTVFRGITPFAIMLVAGVVILIVFPEIATVLPGFMRY
jgi:C4-dicarboxylate transporter, DctM subunit